MGDGSWPNEFTVDGKTSVVLTVNGATADGIVQIDDLALVSAAESRPEARRNLVSFGNFEDGHRATRAWTSQLDAKAGLGRDHYQYHLNDPNGQGYVRAKGRYMAKLIDRDRIYQTVSFPESGLYRVRFLQRTRFSSSQRYGANPLQLVVSNGSVTNVIGRSQVWNGNWEERSFLFTVATAGDWTFSIQGLGASWDGNEIGHESFVDCVSIARVKDALEPAPTVLCRQNPKIDMAQGGRLALDFTGTFVVGALRYNGRRLHGTVNADTRPDFVAGTGSVEIVPDDGLSFIIR